jgi:hypothetical protein
MDAMNNLLAYTADIPTGQAALAMTAEHYQVNPSFLSIFNDSIGRFAFK